MNLKKKKPSSSSLSLSVSLLTLCLHHFHAFLAALYPYPINPSKPRAQKQHFPFLYSEIEKSRAAGTRSRRLKSGLSFTHTLSLSGFRLLGLCFSASLV